MKYKFIYEDSQRLRHTRYYHALNVKTATEMFNASVDHSFGDKNVTLVEIYKLAPGTGWIARDLHLTDTSYTSSLK
tara:strand:- start:60 stop:287 length:228 start_codon:yes stop_codon:yes gene_type:complete